MAKDDTSNAAPGSAKAAAAVTALALFAVVGVAILYALSG